MSAAPGVPLGASGVGQVNVLLERSLYRVPQVKPRVQAQTNELGNHLQCRISIPQKQYAIRDGYHKPTLITETPDGLGEPKLDGSQICIVDALRMFSRTNYSLVPITSLSLEKRLNL